MDLETGAFLHWPLPGTWVDNQHILNAMYIVWRAWKFFHKINDPHYKEWSATDVAYQNWLDEGKPAITVISQAEQWAREQGRLS
jgi:hypothetical protein